MITLHFLDQVKSKKCKTFQRERPIMKLPFLISILFIAKSTIVIADVGGHDLFTSLAQLEVLWHNDREMVSVMEDAIGKMESATQALKE